MYLSGKKIFLEIGFEMWNFKVFEFVLFNLFIGICKLVILEKKILFFFSIGEDCWKQMICIFGLFIYFEYCSKYYLVVGGYIINFEIWVDFCGKNGC